MIREYLDQGYWESVTHTELWDRNAIRYPDKEALLDSTSRLTWLEAKQQMDNMAVALLGLGIGRDDVVAIQLYNCVELFTVRLACLKSGAIFAILGPTLRHTEVEQLLSQLGAVAIVIPHRFRNFDYFQMVQEIRPGLPRLRYVLVIGDDVPEGAISVREMAARQVRDEKTLQRLEGSKRGIDEVGFVTCTSGTTGLPKCPENTIAGPLHAARVYIERYQLTQEDVFAGIAPVIGGAGNLMCFNCAPLLGAKVALLERFTPEDAFRFIERERVTCAGMVPAQMARMIQDEALGKYDLSSLRLIKSATSLLPYQLGVEVEDKLGCRIVQGYGTIDCGNISASSYDDPRGVRLGTVGRPLDGVECRVLDESGREVPLGEVGELVVRGPTCTGGYFGSPETTRQVWQDGWYHTGDLGKLDERANITLVGRKKDIIIRGGQNIYPKEIEDLLTRHPKVRDAAVVAMPDPEMGQRSCAYVTLQVGERLGFEEMVSFLKEAKIASYKLPERLEVVAELPLVADQKIDKRRLAQDIETKLRAEGRL
jgi:non-ribosomal peptide synthetase component E (peptide arylation enzyme)